MPCISPKVIAILPFLLFALIGSSFADSDLLPARDGLPELYAKRIDGLRNPYLALDKSEATKGFYAAAEEWPPNVTKLRVCFFEGSNEIRSTIAKIASVWMDNELSIRLDFGKPNNPRTCGGDGKRPNHIRVGFRQPGYWSTVGQGSMIYAKQDEQSLNFEDFDKLTPQQLETGNDGFLRGTIIHEFGHALGLRHEHQSPNGNCDEEYNWQYIYKYLSGPPNNWSKDQIDFNLRMATEASLMGTDFDPSSVMLYVFPAEFYKRKEASPCFHSTPNNSVSPSDRETVDYMYPVDPNERQKHFAEARASFEAVLLKADSSKRAVLPDYMNVFFGAHDQEQ